MIKKIALTVIFISFLFLIATNLFQVRNIDVEEGPCLTSEAALHNPAIYKKNILLLNTETLENDLKKQFPCLTSTKIKKVLPSKLQISIAQISPLLKIAETNLYIRNDYQIAEGLQGNFPSISLPQELKPPIGEKLQDKSLIFAVDLVQLLSKSDFIISSVRISDSQTVVLYNREGSIAIFSPQRDLKNQVDSLQQVMAAARIDATKIARLDLRFDKPVVTYRQDDQR